MTDKKDFYLGNINLLIYEEFLFISDILSTMLRAFNIQNIHRAANLLEAKNIFEQEKQKGEKYSIDFAIVDLAPPNNHGLELMHWLRHHNNKDIQYTPVIFTTNDAREKIIIDGRDSGVNEILVKPFTAYNVSKRIISIINNPRPFVQSHNFCGPNRRRRVEQHSGAERRLTKEEDIEVIYEDKSEKRQAAS
jgi:DNA-binding response OmpR family regulator